MDLLVLAALVVLALGVAVAVAWGTLAIVFHLMTRRALPVTIHWRPVVFTGALFWFWYLAPGSTPGRNAFAHVLDLLSR